MTQLLEREGEGGFVLMVYYCKVRGSKVPTLCYLYAPHLLALHLRPFHLPFISQDGKQRVTDQHRQPKAPHKSDGIEEIRIPRASIDPQIVECRAEQCRIQQHRC
jgi:hypothetical protein